MFMVSTLYSVSNGPPGHPPVQPRLSWPRKLEAEGTCHPVVKLSSRHSAKSQYHKLSPLNVDLE